jgi:hypothetical protein
MPYSEDDDDCLWHVSTIRSWLNGYDASTNQKRIDYTDNNFLKSAFTNEEQNAIKTTEVVTDKYTDWHFNWTDVHHYYMKTNDKVYLLSFDEMTNKDYGFSADEGGTPSRQAINTAYTAAGGTSKSPYMNKEGTSDSWLLRTPGEYSMYADMITASGEYEEDVSDINMVRTACGIRPLLHFDLSRTDVWTDAGSYTALWPQTITVSSRFDKKYGDEDFSLKATTDGDSILEYKSDKESVATVSSSGTVSIKGVGSATITVNAPATDKYEAAAKTVTINVKKGTRKIECADMTLLITDKGKTLSVKTDEGVALSFESSDISIATVSPDGVVTPKKAGKAVIKVSTSEDDLYLASEATATVTVEKAPSSVSVKKSSATFTAKKLKKKAASFSIGPSSSSGGKVTCVKKSGHKYLTISKAGKVTVKKGAKKGSYTMKVTVKSAATAKYAAASKVFTIKVKIK